MRQWKFASLFLVLVLGAFMAFSSAAFGADKPVELFYSNFFPAPHKQCVSADEWSKEIEKRTGGKVKINLVPGGTLTPADKCYDGVAKGISHIGMSVFSYTVGKFPLLEVLDLPHGVKNGKQATILANEIINKFKPKEVDEVQVMYVMGHGPGMLHTKKAVNKLEDLKNMKIRSTGTIAKIVGALGATPVAMPMPDTYDALSKGVVDGVVCPIECLEGWRLGEVTSFTTDMGGAGYSLGFFVVMNKDAWKSLPPEVQKVVNEVNAEWIGKAGDTWDAIDKSGFDYATKRGNKISKLGQEEADKWGKAVQPLLEDYVKRMKDKGLPGQEALQFYQERMKAMK